LIIPGAVNSFNAVLMLNFFRSLPKGLEEAAFIDGASHWVNLWKIYLPLSKASLATITLFVIVGHWNSWFDGLIYMNSNYKYPLQSLLQTTVVNINTKIWTEHDLQLLKMVNDRTVRAAEIFITMIPILVVYPFLQKYFTTGIVLGSVKG
jgi:putative aldouronate transport system permease protein